MGDNNTSKPDSVTDILFKLLNGIYITLKEISSSNTGKQMEMVGILRDINKNLNNINESLKSQKSSTSTQSSFGVSSSTFKLPDELNNIKVDDKKVILLETNKETVNEAKEEVKNVKEELSLGNIPPTSHVDVNPPAPPISNEKDALPPGISDEEKKKVQKQIQDRLAESSKIAEEIRAKKRVEMIRKFPALQEPGWFEDEESKRLSQSIKPTE